MLKFSQEVGISEILKIIKSDIILVTSSDNTYGPAKQHFYGTGVSVIQFPTKENDGIARARKKFSLLTENELQTNDCPGLDEFVTVPSVTVPSGRVISNSNREST